MSERFKPSLTVALVIENNGKYLIVEETNDDQDGRPVFGNPCGHVEKGESILEAALREGREETGEELELLSLISVSNYVKDQETILRFCFEARMRSVPENLCAQDPDHEINAVKWYTKDEIYSGKAEWRTRLVGQNFDDYFAGSRFPLEIIRTVRP